MPEKSALAEEQEFLDIATARRESLVENLHGELTAEARDEVERARQRLLRRQYDQMRRAAAGLVFGRLDALDGTARHIGRVGLPATGGDEPLLLDWRTPAARPFYTATAVAPQGQARRRHIRTDGSTVIGVDDEPLDGVPSELVGAGALLAALDQRRTGHMTTAIATLQTEQDQIIRAAATGPLIVQGGPGTGKTVVALHRVAYLLFTHQRTAEQAVLLLGPSARFLDYIARVLPALGETAVVAATCDTLLPGVVADRAESREAAEIKGRALWQDVLERKVKSLVPRPRELKLRWDGDFHVIPAATVAETLAAVTRDNSYHRARTVFAEHLHRLLADAVAEQRETMLERMDEGYEDILSRFGPAAPLGDDVLLSDEEIDELRERIAGNSAIARFIETLWPTRTPGEVLRSLRASDLAPDLTPAEIAAVTGGPFTGWSAADIPLLDALAELLGETETTEPQGEFTADRARGRRDWVYGHVVVDEAQELSEMQWRMVLRRCPSRSVTAVGDIDQAEAAHRHTTWDEAVQAVFGTRWTRADLTICYRTPREVMALTAPVLSAAGSRNTPPRAVRSSGIEPWRLTVSPDDLPETAARVAEELRRRWAGGTVGVIAPASRIDTLRPFLGDVPLLTATQSKGLEWDATLLIDAAALTTEPRGHNALYVALTRCTQELAQFIVT